MQTTFYADTDGDGYGDPANTIEDCAAPTGYVADNTDCDDTDADEFPGQAWYNDVDNDGYRGNIAVASCERPEGYKLASEFADFNTIDCNDNDPTVHTFQTWYEDQDDDGYTSGVIAASCARPTGFKTADELVNTTDLDCNDADPAINPAATEICDGIDNNCDGQIDEGVQTTFYADADGDGYGDPANTIEDCAAPTGYVSDNTDCDDTDADEFPDQTWFPDQDNDGYGNGTALSSCERPSGYKLAAELIDPTVIDCNDNDPAVYTFQTWYEDQDDDGYTSGTIAASCARPAGFKTAAELVNTTDLDCNDADPAVNPAATEICDGIDNNCDGQIDEGVQTTFYADSDGDGYGDPAVSIQGCAAPDGYVADNTDCDDSDSNEFPSQTWYKDADNDGYSDGATLTQCQRPAGYKTAAELTDTDGDCNDDPTAGGSAINPAAAEICDGLDNNCNGLIDADDPGLEDTTAPTALCRDVTVQLDASGAGSTTASAVDNGSSDACGIQSAVLSRQSFSCADIGANTVTLTVTDLHGNESACTATVAVADNIAPQMDCHDIAVAFNSEGSIALEPEALAFAADNCSVQSLTADLQAVNCAAVGEVIPVTVRAVDPGGNAASCVSNVTVEGLPCGWMTTPDGIDCDGGSDGSYDADTESFTLVADGCNSLPISPSDESAYIKYQLCGNGSITAHIAGMSIPGFAGIVMRESDDPGAKKVAIGYHGGSTLTRYVRYFTGGLSYPAHFQAFGARWLRIVRTGNIFRGYYSLNGNNWIYAFAVVVPMDNCIQVGLVAWSIAPNQVVTATFDHVVIDSPSGGGLPKGAEINAQADLATGAAPADLWPNPSSGAFNLALDPAWGDEVTVEVLDGVGRSVAARIVDTSDENQVRFNLEDQPPGIYLLRIEGQNGLLTTRRMVIAR
ncbi:MAG: T9SS type A sorting domain-containing protein [Lewinellaceae bacterium]|nr:T9SS type A sorting domain-containing protein [Lewinellaceae bacterium]